MANVVGPYVAAQVAYQVGLRGDSLRTAVAIAGAESSWTADDLNDTPATGDYSVGLWQINYYANLRAERTAKYGPPASLYDPLANARAMYDISGGGTRWRDWSTFKSGAYRSYLARANQAAAQVEANPGAPLAVGGSNQVPGASQTAAVLTPDLIEAQFPAEVILTFTPPAQIGTFLFVNTPGFWSQMLASVTIGGTVEMSLEDASQIVLVIDDPGLHYWDAQQQSQGPLTIGSNNRWLGQDWTVSAVEVRQGPAREQVAVTMRTSGAYLLKRLIGARTWPDSSPTQVMEELATPAGLGFVGQGSYRQPTLTMWGIAAAVGDPTGQQKPPSAWDMGKMFGSELGFLAFEAMGTYFFGRPSWLISRLPKVKLGWRGAWGTKAVDAIEVTSARASIDDQLVEFQWNAGVPVINPMPGQDGFHWRSGWPPRTITLKVDRTLGEGIRPGMCLEFKGLPGFEDNLLVSKVSWPIDGGVEPVEVTAIDAVDPIPSLTSLEFLDPTSPTAGTGGAAGNGSNPGTPGTGLCWPFPTRDPGQYRRVDQGWDLQVTVDTPIVAVASGTVTYAHDPNGFGDPYPVLTLDTPVDGNPAVYYGHNHPDVPQGAHVARGQTICHALQAPGGNARGDPGWLEIGWWRNGPTGDGQSMHDHLIDAPIVTPS